MKMRKVMSVALVAAMCATMCPITASAKDDNVTIEYWHTMAGVNGEAMETIVNDFNETVGKEKGITVKSVYQGDDVSEKLKTLAQANDTKNFPNVAQIVCSGIPSAINYEQLVKVEDLYKEEFGACPAVHHAMEYYGEKCTLDEIRYVKKLKIEHIYYRDKEEVDFIDSVLEEIKDEYYGGIIKMIYFDKMKIEDIANKMSCDKVTLYRHRNRLLDILSIRFFGKDVLE